MIDLFVLVTPVLLLAVMGLLRFVGCDVIFKLREIVLVIEDVSLVDAKVCEPARLSVVGRGFAEGDVVIFNGEMLPTTFISITLLEAVVSLDVETTAAVKVAGAANRVSNDFMLNLTVSPGVPRPVAFPNTTPGQPLLGIHVSNGNRLDFGSGGWVWGSTTLPVSTPNFIMFSSGGNSRSFAFVDGERLLQNISVFNMSPSANTLLLSDGENPPKSVVLPPFAAGQPDIVIQTDWTQCALAVTIQCTDPQLGVTGVTYLGPQ